MLRHEALYDEATDGDVGAAGGAAAGGAVVIAPEFVPPKDGSWVPKVRMDEATGELKDRIRQLEARLDAAPREKPADQPKRWTRAELNAAVEARQITQDQADDVLDRQIREDAKAEAAQVAHDTVIGTQRKEHVTSQLARYKRAEPEIVVAGSDVRKRITEEFRYLVDELGDQNSIDTELKAIRAVLGPIDRLEKSRAGRPDAETHQEAGQGGESGKPKVDKDTPLVGKLDKRQRDYYEGQIKSGQYKDWKDVEATLKYANPETRPSLGAG